MEPNAPERPAYDDGSTELVQPVEPVRPVEPARPVEYRRSVVQTEEVSPLARVGQVICVTLRGP
jgi:hypothetical protein